MDTTSALFYLFSVVMLFAAFRVITASNTVHAALYLVLAFFQASGLWMLLKAEFLSITLVLVYVDGAPAGCCALRPLPDCDYRNACEMKRFFVRRAFRGLGLGRQLLEHTLVLARQAGYDTLLLDTFLEMETARAMYQDIGFVEIPPYYHNPLPGAHYLMLKL